MKRAIRAWVWASVLVAVAIAGFLFLRPRPVPADVAQVSRGPMMVTVEEEGETRIHDHFVISAPVAGRLLRIYLHAGDGVVPGQIVARLLPAPIEPRQRAELVAQVAAAAATKREASAQVERAQNEHEQQQRDRSRAEQLASSGVISRKALEQAQTAEVTGGKALDAARNRVEAAASQEAAAQARLLEAERSGPAGVVVAVKSPLKGRVLRLLQQSERVVSAGEPLLDLGYSPRLEVVTDVLSTEAVKVHPGDPVQLEGWGGSKKIRARVRLVEPSGFTKVSALGIEEQRVNVVIDFVDPPGPLGDGYRVEARIIVWQAQSVVKLPTSALFRQGQSWAVFAVEGGRAHLREVEIGHRNASEAEVLGGINAGGTVILHPTNQIEEGIRVGTR
ncbi:MAG TPA: efflux RND transporter periplasmic adaptor subunit [Candidatus Acidoferrales bacterium]|nr:efflux RND transporter periplasmic adaptor subunit [Candidatus Acidoferrales bacterium]